ncbi:MAG: transglycosylase SLT domain-containing protein [Gammaproteobacteria bacterium]
MPTTGPRLASAVCAAALLLTSAVASAAGDLFPRPEGLEPDIAFWADIYSAVPSTAGVLHDSRDLRVRYETLDLGGTSSRRARHREIENRKKHYRRILERLASGRRDGLDEEERRVLALWPDGVSNQRLAQAARDVRFQLGQSDRFLAGLRRSGRYKPHIAQVLAERGLPAELIALPHVESSFNPDAYSKVGAAGMWQFTRSTGRRFMRIDHVVDERRDPFLSTTAAARLLENNYAVTGSWPLALTGYNHGVAGMRRAARQLGTSDIETIVRNYRGRAFGFASRNFYVAFLAALQIDREPEKYFGKVAIEAPAGHEFLTVESYTSAAGLARALGMTPGELRRHNPALQHAVWSGDKHIPRGFTLRLPAGALRSEPTAVLAALGPDSVFERQRPDVMHRVVRGDTLSGIASYYEVSVSDLVALNGLASRHRIRAGQVLRLPADEATVELARVAREARAAAPPPAAPAPPAATDEPAYDTELIAAALLGNLPAPADGYEEVEGSGLATAQTALAADPADYAVAEDGTVEIQAMETLGHYADWLQIRTQRLRDINGYSFRRPVKIGERLRLEFGTVDRERFEQRRLAYHQGLQERFFQRYRISDAVEHRIRRGESVWLLALRDYDVPVWLLRQYNPDLQLDRIRPGMRLQFPVLAPIAEDGDSLRVAGAG